MKKLNFTIGNRPKSISWEKVYTTPGYTIPAGSIANEVTQYDSGYRPIAGFTIGQEDFLIHSIVVHNEKRFVKGQWVEALKHYPADNLIVELNELIEKTI